MKQSPNASENQEQVQTAIKHWKTWLVILAVQLVLLGVLAILGKYVIPKYWPDFLLEFDFLAMAEYVLGDQFRHIGVICFATVLAVVVSRIYGNRLRKK